MTFFLEFLVELMELETHLFDRSIPDVGAQAAHTSPEVTHCLKQTKTIATTVQDDTHASRFPTRRQKVIHSISVRRTLAGTIRQLHENDRHTLELRMHTTKHVGNTFAGNSVSHLVHPHGVLVHCCLHFICCQPDAVNGVRHGLLDSLQQLASWWESAETLCLA